MNSPLKILHLEDMPNDAELVARELNKAGIQYESILAENKIGFVKALQSFSPDIILSDHSLASFDSREALKIVRDMNIHVPFILVTATVSEEYAVSVLKEGASDYVLKDRLQRLPSSVLAALEKYKMENESRLAADALAASEQKYKLLFWYNPLPIWIVSKTTGHILAVNESALTHYGYTEAEFLQLRSADLGDAREGQEIRVHKKKNGSSIFAEVILHDFVYENTAAILVLVNDVTEKIKAEHDLSEERNRQQKLLAETGIHAQERERNEIGLELHDNINQILAAAKLCMEVYLKNENIESELLNASLDNIVLAIAEIRKLSHSLVAPSLGDVPLISAIAELLREIPVSSLEVELLAENFDEGQLHKEAKLVFYRIIQEQLNNIIKHSGAKKAVIKLSSLQDHLLLSVADDGRGFDTNKKAEGIGLKNIRHRAGLYDGSVYIISSPGKGFTIEVSIPFRFHQTG